MKVEVYFLVPISQDCVQHHEIPFGTFMEIFNDKFIQMNFMMVAMPLIFHCLPYWSVTRLCFNCSTGTRAPRHTLPEAWAGSRASRKAPKTHDIMRLFIPCFFYKKIHCSIFISSFIFISSAILIFLKKYIRCRCHYNTRHWQFHAPLSVYLCVFFFVSGGHVSFSSVFLEKCSTCQTLNEMCSVDAARTHVPPGGLAQFKVKETFGHVQFICSLIGHSFRAC